MATVNRGDGSGGALLRQWRKEHDVTMEVLAERLGVTRNHIGMLESGATRPSLKLAVRLSSETGIPESAWIAEREAVPA